MLKQNDRAEAVVACLRRREVVGADAVERARRAAEAEGLRIDLALFRLGLAPEAALAAAYAEACGCNLFEPDEASVAALDEFGLPPDYLGRARILPLGLDGERLRVAMADPLDTTQLRALAMKTGCEIVVLAARPSDIEACLKRLRAAAGPGPAEDALDQTDIDRLRSIASDAPVIRLVDQMLATAVQWHASDVHLLPARGGLRLRYRVDGRLLDAEPPPPGRRAAVISRLKLMAGLDIAETRLPQDGRIRAVIGGRELDLRISVAPSVDGESVVVRILDGGGERPEMGRLGISPGILARLEELTDRPSGVTIVTGPTGSGKTTTLYAALRRMSRPDRHIASIEDPVEYRLEGVNQIQVRPEIGFDFPQALRHLLRHDPDVVMIGEIRDGETARIGLQSALTGHPVLATLHTNDAASAIPRLTDMGAAPYLVSAVLNGVIAQRLVRRLCPECSRPAEPGAAMIEAAARHGVELRRLREAAGCANCRGTGYRGRIPVAEVMVIGEELREFVRDGASVDALRRAAAKAGMRGIHDDGFSRVAEGVTTFEEIAQILGSPLS